MSGVNGKIQSAVQLTKNAIVGPGASIEESRSTARQVGQAAAYEAVAQATAFAVQDAASYMRNVNAVTQAALAVVTQEMMAGAKAKSAGDREESGARDRERAMSSSEWSQLITNLTNISEGSVKQFERIGKAAATIAKEFPAAGTYSDSSGQDLSQPPVA